jgi:hypothetical protein
MLVVRGGVRLVMIAGDDVVERIMRAKKVLSAEGEDGVVDIDKGSSLFLFFQWL